MTPAELLLEALEHFVRNEAGPQLSGFAGYQSRIAANLLRMLQRESGFAPLRDAIDDRLEQLTAPVSGDAATTTTTTTRASDSGDAATTATSPQQRLALRLRDGATTDSAALRELLRERCLLNLAIDNPRYSGYREGRERWAETTRRIDQRIADSESGL